jgi:hypothetical protein
MHVEIKFDKINNLALFHLKQVIIIIIIIISCIVVDLVAMNQMEL